MAPTAKAELAAKRKRKVPDAKIAVKGSSKELPEADFVGGLHDAELELGQEEGEGSDEDEIESDAELDPFPEIDLGSSDGEDAEARQLSIGQVHGKKVVEADDSEIGEEDGQNDEEEGYDSDDIDNWDEDAEDGECDLRLPD